LTTLIICYGNDLMGNDAFGRAVYEVLPDSPSKIFSHQLFPELLEVACEYDRLIFVDASHGAGDTIIQEIFSDDTDTANFHNLTAQTFLKLLETLYDKTPKAYLCTAFFYDFELGAKDEDFDEKVAVAVASIRLFYKFGNPSSGELADA
jgi:hydrogenase maturation protease